MEAKHIIHKANSRGHADYGWLNTYHTFSFGDYYDPNRVNFGAFRVLNDDTIDGGTGFDTHPHKNMEIITIPLDGALAHKDSMGNASVITQGEIQVMSAGTGIYHSEFNHFSDKKGHFLQLWIIPNKENVTPRYGQLTISRDEKTNKFHQIVSPDPLDEGLWIHQQAWIHIGKLEAGDQTVYHLKKEGNGVYIFVIDGFVNVNHEELSERDGMGITDCKTIAFSATKNTEVLIIEVPMN